MRERRLLATLVVVAVLGVAPAQGPGAAAPAPSEAEAPAAGAPAAVPEEVMTQGQELFEANCAACHAIDGTGAVGPALADPERVRVEADVIRQVLRGSLYMPAFAGKLDDEQIASVITYVRNSFGNGFGPTTPEAVAEHR